MQSLKSLSNKDLATLFGLIEALLIWQQAALPELIPRDVALVLGGAAIAGSGYVTNKKDCPKVEAPVIEPVIEPPVDKFKRALEFTSVWEGGEVNHPNDIGGHTNLGVTQATYDTYRAAIGKEKRSVKYLNKAESEAVYKKLYWDMAKCDRCVLPLAIAYFDSCVNFGVGGGISFLQDALGVEPDGNWGNASEAAFKGGNTKETAIRLIESRIRYRHQRVAQKASQKVFLTGWLNRDNALMSLVRGMP